MNGVDSILFLLIEFIILICFYSIIHLISSAIKCLVRYTFSIMNFLKLNKSVNISCGGTTYFNLIKIYVPSQFRAILVLVFQCSIIFSNKDSVIFKSLRIHKIIIRLRLIYFCWIWIIQSKLIFSIKEKWPLRIIISYLFSITK